MIGSVGKNAVIEKSLNHQTMWSDDNFHLLSKHRPVQLQPVTAVMFKTSLFVSVVPGNYHAQPVTHGHLARWHRRAQQGGTLTMGDDWIGWLAQLRSLNQPAVAFSWVCGFLVCFVPSCFATTHYLPHTCWLFILPSFVPFLSPCSPLRSLPLSCFSLLPSPFPHILTGVVIPSPQWRLNDFILPRLCLLLLMMCLVPSYFDADYQSLLVNACVCWE